MNFRDTILQNVRNNQPSARELPAVPKFHSEQPVDLKREFTAALKELYGEVVTEPPADFQEFLRKRFPDAKRSVRRSRSMPVTECRKTSLAGRTPPSLTLRSYALRSAWPKPVRCCFQKKSSASILLVFWRTT